jgi:hypothetical protein
MRTRSRPRTPGRVRPALLVPAVVAIVLGILGMHGFDTHGVNLHGTMAHTEAGTSAASVMPDHDPVAAERGDAHSTAHPGTSAAGPVSGEAVGMTGLVMLCVAMLAGAAAALLALLVRRSRLPKVWALLQPAGRVWRPEPLVLRVGTGPPSAWRFSVIRC